MKKSILSIPLFLLISVCFASCKPNKQNLEFQTEEVNMNRGTKPIAGKKVKIKIAGKTFTATILDNETAKAFRAILPLTLDMNELNSNEKYGQLPKKIPTKASVPLNIESGDLMLFGSSTLVLFYNSFSTSYNYTKIGKIDNVNGLVESLGKANVKVQFDPY